MSSELEKFKEFCQKTKLKITKERITIFETILSLHHHFTVDELNLKLQQNGIRVALSSIYRLVPYLIKAGLIKSIFLDDKSIYYEHVCGHPHHDHLICSNCGNIIEFCDEAIEVLQEHVAKKYNFKILDHRLIINGLCSNCR